MRTRLHLRPGMFRRAALAAALTLFAPTTHAQSLTRAVAHDFRAAGSDVWWLWTSPVHATKRDWRDAAIVAGTAGLIGTADPRIDRWIVRNGSSALIKALDPFREHKGIRPIDLGSGNLLLPLSGGLYVTGLAARSRALRDAGIGCATAQQSNSILRGAIYSLVQRPRPDSANGRAYRFAFPGAGWEKHSFFGGHVANAMACATYASTRFELGPAEPLLYASAAAIGLGRMADRRHWASDTFLGAAFGYAMGRSVGLRQLHRLERERGGRTTLDEPRGQLYVGAAPDGSAALGWRAAF